MAYREKTAWLTLICMVLAYGCYFGWVVHAAHAGQPRLIDLVWWFGGITAVQAVVVIIGSIVLALRAGGEARASADERDRAIARRGANISYYVLMVGMILVGVVMPFGGSPWKIINHALLALVVAESVRHIVILLSYRRGWHG